MAPGRREDRAGHLVRVLCGRVLGRLGEAATPHAGRGNIADTNTDLAGAQPRHSFREDLYSQS